MIVLPVIMSGGSGTRLWPASTEERPKQFHALGSSQTMLQDTAARVHADGFLAPLVIGNHRHGGQVLDQLQAIGMAPQDVILEPFGRNTASVGVIAAAWAERHAPGTLVLLMPADHVVEDAVGFRAAVAYAARAAQDRIVTFGIEPSGPETGYGYIQSGEALYDGVFAVQRFVEKPARPTAEAYLAEGGYSWNAGIFLYQPALFLAEAERLCPEIVAAAEAALDGAIAIDGGRLLDPGQFGACPSQAIDVAVMEKTDKAAVMPISVGWADIGSWSELWRHGAAHDQANHTRGDTEVIDSAGSLLWSDGPTISVIGLSDIVVVATGDHVLVLPKDRAQDVKAIVEKWKGEVVSTELAPLAGGLIDWAERAALPLWWTAGADHARGGFHEALDQTGAPVAANRRARVQARQVYVYATAGDLGWSGPWRDAVAHGLDFFLARYRRGDGLYRTVVSPEGVVVDDAAWLYDQAFALFAMAQATRAGAADLRAQALDLVKALEAWRLPEGGFLEPPARYDHQSNPHMHLFEASLAWAAVDDAPVWNALADEIAALAMRRFVDAQGQLHEFFAPGWVFAEGVDGRIVEPGHQFEWAWLLARWAKLRGREDAHAAALRMFEAGKRGVDARRGVATQQLLDDGVVHDDVARLWPQTERIKAALILDDRAEAVRGIEGLKLYLDTPVEGLWWDKFRPDGTFVDEPAPASSFYHILCAIAELKAAVAVA